MSTTGLVFGKYAPLHNGHINHIFNAATQVDHLYVVMSYDQKFVDSLKESIRDKLSFKNRMRWLLHTFDEFDHISVEFIDETNLKEYPHGWSEWANLIMDVLPTRPDKIFTSEPSYDEGISKYFPNAEHIITNRTDVNISATEIRHNVMQFWDYIPSIVRKEFVKTVCVVGTESCAKSTLVKYLAKAFNTSWVDEYGRTFVEDNLFGVEQLLQVSDYRSIAMRHLQEVEDAKKTANRVLFVDTNLSVTQYYLKMYTGEDDPVVDALAAMESYDLVLFMEDDVPWVSDGMRSMSDRTQEAKQSLMGYLRLNNTAVIVVNGNYQERLNHAKEIVLNEIMGGNV